MDIVIHVLPHSILLIESLDLVCVADRENGRYWEEKSIVSYLFVVELSVSMMEMMRMKIQMNRKLSLIIH